MSRENLPQDRRAQVDAIFSAANARDFEALGEMPFHPDFEFRSVLAVVEGGVYHGIQGLREWARDLDSIFDDYTIEVGGFQEVDDERAVVVAHLTGKGKASGLPVDERVGQIWTWRNGLVWRTDTYFDFREALEAVGLRE